MCTSEEGQEGGAGKPVNNTAIRRRGVSSCTSRPQPSMASPVRSLCLSCRAWNLQLPLGQMVPQCYFRTCPRTHPCFSIPTTTVLAQFHHHLLPGLLTGLESHPVCPPCSSQGFSPALHLRWLPMASRINSSYWKPSLPQPCPSPATEDWFSFPDPRPPSAHARYALLHGLCVSPPDPYFKSLLLPVAFAGPQAQ